MCFDLKCLVNVSPPERSGKFYWIYKSSLTNTVCFGVKCLVGLCFKSCPASVVVVAASAVKKKQEELTWEEFPYFTPKEDIQIEVIISKCFPEKDELLISLWGISSLVRAKNFCVDCEVEALARVLVLRKCLKTFENNGLLCKQWRVLWATVSVVICLCCIFLQGSSKGQWNMFVLLCSVFTLNQST